MVTWKFSLHGSYGHLVAMVTGFKKWTRESWLHAYVQKDKIESFAKSKPYLAEIRGLNFISSV